MSLEGHGIRGALLRTLPVLLHGTRFCKQIKILIDSLLGAVKIVEPGCGTTMMLKVNFFLQLT